MNIIYRLLFLIFISMTMLYAKEPITPIPKSLPYNHAKAQLGKVLFLDPMLSSDGTISCASCHSFEHGGADPKPYSLGVEGQKGDANSPTVYNSYFNFRQFWNGSAKDLKDQAKGPLHNPVEMGMNRKKINHYLQKSLFYMKEFKKVYRKKPNYEEALDAIAEFEKALYTPNCKFDRYLRGETKLNPLEKKGYRLFKTLGCITCHNGINIGGNSYQKMGLIFPYPHKKNTPDRYAITHKKSDKNVYKVPTLRNITLTAPYFHDGSASTLKKALKMMAYHNLGSSLDQSEIDALEAFLNTLTGEKPKILKNED